MSERNNKIAVSNSKMSERNDKSAGCKFQWQNVRMQEQNYSSKIPEDNNKRAGSNSKISEHNNKTAGSNSRIPYVNFGGNHTSYSTCVPACTMTPHARKNQP